MEGNADKMFEQINKQVYAKKYYDANKAKISARRKQRRANKLNKQKQ